MKWNYKCLFLLIVLGWVPNFLIWSQTTHEITVSSNLFSPSTLTINQGDIVTWNCIQGSHNVNGLTSTFPSNPASFGNNVQSAPWNYSYTFDIPGVYNYQCDPHAFLGMKGSITVLSTTSVDENTRSKTLNVFQTPEGDYIVFELKNDSPDNPAPFQLTISNLLGAKVFQSQYFDNQTIKIPVTDWPVSTYIYQLNNNNGSLVITGKFIKH